MPIIIFFIRNISRQDFTVFNCKIKEKTGCKNATNHIIQAISMTVQRGNAISVMCTLGSLRKLFCRNLTTRREIINIKLQLSLFNNCFNKIYISIVKNEEKSIQWSRSSHVCYAVKFYSVRVRRSTLVNTICDWKL